MWLPDNASDARYFEQAELRHLAAQDDLRRDMTQEQAADDEDEASGDPCDGEDDEA